MRRKRLSAAERRAAQKIVKAIAERVMERAIEKIVEKATDEIVNGDGIGFKPLRYKRG